MDAMKANEVREIAVNAAKDYVKGRIAKGKDGSPSVGLVHAGLLVHVMNEVRSTIDDAEPEEVINESLFIAFAEVENGSALRQKFEKDGTLPKTSKAAAMASEYL